MCMFSSPSLKQQGQELLWGCPCAGTCSSPAPSRSQSLVPQEWGQFWDQME